MLSITGYLRDRLRLLWNERGAETAEWMIIVGLLTAIAIIIYAAPAGPIGAMISAVALAVQNAVTGLV